VQFLLENEDAYRAVEERVKRRLSAAVTKSFEEEEKGANLDQQEEQEEEVGLGMGLEDGPVEARQA